MSFDLRFPIGLMFSLFGALLAIFGFFSDPALYAKSLGTNVNLIWGTIMLIFGIAMLFLAWRSRATTATERERD